MVNNLILTLEEISTISSIEAQQPQMGISLGLDLGELLSISLLENAVLLIQYDRGELRIGITIEEIMKLRDETGTILLRSNIS